MLVVLLALVAFVHVAPAGAVCPQTLTDCFGAATSFNIVADELNATRGAISSGEGYIIVSGSSMGDVCAGTAFVAGPSCDRSAVERLILTEPSRAAATFAGFPCPFDGTPAGIGVTVFGDVVTGGGALRNQDAADLRGLVDTSGGDPRIATCNQALADMRSASATLSALTPTRDLGSITVAPYNGPGTGFMRIAADPGVNVWTAHRISLPSKRNGFTHEVHESALIIELDPATESVVLNVRNLTVKHYSGFYVDGDASKVVINLPTGGIARTRGGTITPWVLGPEGRIQIKSNWETDSGPLGAFAGRVGVFGGVVR